MFVTRHVGTIIIIVLFMFYRYYQEYGFPFNVENTEIEDNSHSFLAKPYKGILFLELCSYFVVLNRSL